MHAHTLTLSPVLSTAGGALAVLTPPTLTHARHTGQPRALHQPQLRPQLRDTKVAGQGRAGHRPVCAQGAAAQRGSSGQARIPTCVQEWLAAGLSCLHVSGVRVGRQRGGRAPWRALQGRVEGRLHRAGGNHLLQADCMGGECILLTLPDSPPSHAPPLLVRIHVRTHKCTHTGLERSKFELGSNEF